MDKIQYKEKLAHGTADFPIAIYELHFAEEREVLFTLHYHDEFEFLWITAGAVVLQMNDKNIMLRKGDGVFINSGALHMAMSHHEGACSFIAIVFNPEWIAASKERIYNQYFKDLIRNPLKEVLWLDENVKHTMQKAAALWKEQPAGYELQIKSCLMEISTYAALEAQVDTSSRKKPKETAAKEVIDYIHDHYMDKITLDSIAEAVHLSNEHLCRSFKEISGESPFTYLNRFRVMKSCDLLEATEWSIARVAQSCGFNSSSYYNRIFMRIMNCTPKQYRNRRI